MKNKILRVYNFFSNKAVILYNFILSIISKPPKIKLIDETIIKILNDKASVSRFGDGELCLINGQGIKYQEADKTLQRRLKEILKSNSKNHIVTIPDVFVKERLELRTEENKKFWKKNLSFTRKDWYKNLDLEKQYYNTAISRFYIPIKDKSKSIKSLDLLKNIWNNRDIIIVEGYGSRLGVGNDLFDNSKSIFRILAPAENAFRRYDEIIEAVKKVNKDKLILIALGPTATVLAYDLYKLGYWAIDIGHIDLEYEWLKMNAKKQVKILNKYTNEVENGDKISECTDLKYNSEIINKIY